jgi:GT2 family glycosyltransferase
MTSVSVVVCTYAEQRQADVLDNLRALEEQTLQPLEIVLVVDHNPALLERLEQETTGATVVANQGNRGLSGARNTGIAAARGDLVAFLDDDAVAAPDWVEALFAAYSPGVLGVGGRIEPDWATVRPGWFPAEFDWVVGCSYRGLPESRAAVRNLIGANMSFRRELLETVGGFSEALGRVGSVPTGCEETELCLRMSRRWPQGEFVYEPRARVFHRIPVQRARVSYFLARCRGEGRSKAILASRLGSAPALAAERSHLRRTLPRALAREFRLFLRGRPAGLLASCAIAAGVASAGFGYCSARLRRLTSVGAARRTLPVVADE